MTVDGELWRNTFGLRLAAGERGDLEIELPFVFATSGMLDRLVESFHDLLLLPGGGREERPDFEYEVEIVDDSFGRIYELEPDRLGIGDVPIVYTRRIVDEGDLNPGVAVRAGIELPIGSEERGFGNGRFDAGVGVLVERSFGRWTATGAVDWSSAAASDAFRAADVEVYDDLDVQLGTEYRWNDRLSLLAGLIVSSQITDDLNVEELESEVLQLDVGWAFDVAPGSRLTVSFAEDLASSAGPDFTVFVGLAFSL